MCSHAASRFSYLGPARRQSSAIIDNRTHPPQWTKREDQIVMFGLHSAEFVHGTALLDHSKEGAFGKDEDRMVTHKVMSDCSQSRWNASEDFPGLETSLSDSATQGHIAWPCRYFPRSGSLGDKEALEEGSASCVFLTLRLRPTFAVISPMTLVHCIAHR